MIDAFAYPKKAGGFHEVLKCLKNGWKELDEKVFLKYLLKFNNVSLNAKIGYILEELNLKNIKVSLPSAYVRLNNEKPMNKTKNKKWRIIINDDVKKEEEIL